MRKFAPLAVFAAALAGCPNQNPPDDAGGCTGEFDAAAPASVSLGYGDPAAPTHFRPLTAGQDVALTAGSQGSQHVWIQVQGAGLCPDHPRVTCTVTLTDTGRTIGTSNVSGVRWIAVGGSPGSYMSAPLTCRIEDNEYCALLHGGHITVHLHVDDTEGHSADAEIPVVLNGFSPDTSPSDEMAREQCCADYTNVICWPNGPPDGAVTDASSDVGAGDGALGEDASVDTGSDASAD